ncbi:hypothetical protein TrLO_g4440 [Triparma laevis f. longispina]|uniref:RNA-polymerase II-associated protein 3-like C-terminal domain-containing protein n=1 Tax=Triparma laevis f. longispina TaxID=1714387 RepID=A0A9W7FRE3_9STRA|nr:hypothetical protein TrLO_g4440 [Triparma laevis f. longispina]
MAELGDFLLGMGDPDVDKINVDVNMLDYDYVAKCDRITELKAILKVLTSGKEGRFPHLERTVEEKVLALMPEKDRKKILSMRQVTSQTEVYDEEKALSEWLTNMGGDEKKSTTSPSTSSLPPPPVDSGEIFGSSTLPPPAPPSKIPSTSSRSYPPVRGSKEASLKISREARGKPSTYTETTSTPEPRLNKESMTNRDYFRAWDKFDVEKEIESLDAEDEAARIKAKEAREGAKAREEKNRRRREQEINDLRDKLNFDNMSIKERKWMSQREKNKGNECFRSGENEDALLFYSRAIALDDSNAVIYANRAMANIRLNNFDAAVSDCTMSLNIDPTYTKALSRRGMVHHRCGRYRLAEDDFGLCKKREPENQEFKALLERSTQKRKEVEGEVTHQKTKKKVMIQEVSDSEESSEEEEEEEILEIGADGFDISAAPKPKPAKTSKPAKKPKKIVSEERFIASKTFTGPKPGMVFKKGDDGIMGYYRDGPDPKPAKSSKPAKPAFKKIAIVESDSDSESESDEEPTVTTATQLKEQGNLAMAKSSYKEAIKLYTEALELDAKNSASLNNRALAYLKMKQFELAFADADAALKIDPTNVKAHFRRGLAGKEQSLSSSSLSTAKADFEKVVKMEPDNTIALKELKSVGDKLALLTMVEDDDNNEPALMVDPNSSQSSSNASSKDNSPMGFTNITEEEVEEAKANSPSAGLAKTKKKILIEEENDDDSDEEEAAAAAPPAKKKIVIEESDDDEEEDDDDDEDVTTAENLKNEGNKLLSAGKFADAIKKYDAAFALDSKNVAAVNNKTLALLKLSKFAEAGVAADQVLKLEPDNVKGVFRKACAIAGNGESAGIDSLKEAMAMFEKSNKLGGGGGKNCKEKDACAKTLAALEKSLKDNELRKMASNNANKGGASPASKAVIEKKVDDAMKKLNSSDAKNIVTSAKNFGVPKTTTEMETAVRSLKSDASGEAVTGYLASFKPATFKKCFNSSMDPDLLSHVFQGLSKTWNNDCSDRNTKVVNQLAKVAKNLAIVFMVLDDKAKAAVADILKKAGGDKVTSSFWKKSFKGAL